MDAGSSSQSLSRPPSPIPEDPGATGDIKQLFLEAIQEEIRDEQIARHMSYVIESFGPEEIGSLARILEGVERPEAFNLLDRIAQLQSRMIQKGLDQSRRTIAIYYPTCAYRESLGEIAAKLRQASRNVVTLVGEIARDELEEREHVLFGGQCGGDEMVSAMDCVDMFIFPHIVLDLPARAKRVYFPHDMHDCIDLSIYRGRGVLDEGLLGKIIHAIDYIFVPLKYDMAHLPRLIASCKEKYGISKEVCLIPGGYIKLDRNIAYHHTHAQESRTIVYALTISGLETELSPLCGIQYAPDVIDAVLNHFPEYELVFRPHPHIRTTPRVREIVKRFSGRRGFIFDDNPGSYMRHYSKAALMITDFSGTAYTFAFSTLRPVIFFSPHPELFAEQFRALRFTEDRHRVGAVVASASELVQQIERFLVAPGAIGDQIRAYRDSLVYNLGTAEEYFVSSHASILDGQRQPDWIYI